MTKYNIWFFSSFFIALIVALPIITIFFSFFSPPPDWGGSWGGVGWFALSCFQLVLNNRLHVTLVRSACSVFWERIPRWACIRGGR